MAGIFPFLNAPGVGSVKKDLPMFREYAWDYEENGMQLVNGTPVILEGNEALRVWIYKALQTARYRHLGYTRSYGSELEKLIGSSYTLGATQIEVERYVREALLVNPYIRSVPQVKALLDGERLTGYVIVETVYGEVKADV
ncbi:MAG: phage protein [Paenibacillaceae bacterium]|jgi:hypothetical protein|nr:phage protein [Paenibacillaceae bacterium]